MVVDLTLMTLCSCIIHSSLCSWLLHCKRNKQHLNGMCITHGLRCPSTRLTYSPLFRHYVTGHCAVAMFLGTIHFTRSLHEAIPCFWLPWALQFLWLPWRSASYLVCVTVAHCLSLHEVIVLILLALLETYSNITGCYEVLWIEGDTPISLSLT